MKKFRILINEELATEPLDNFEAFKEVERLSQQSINGTLIQICDMQGQIIYSVRINNE